MPTPTQTLDIEPYLKQWLSVRVPELADRVYPFTGVQDTADPYCVYQRTKGERWSDQMGPDGVSATLFQVDVWSRRRQTAKAASDRICGTLDDPGLAGYRGALVAPSLPGSVWVQRVNHSDEFEDDADPEQGEERGWVRVSREYHFYFEETLRDPP